MLQLNIGRARLTAIRQSLGHIAEHVDSTSVGSPVWFFAPIWLVAWAAARGGSSGGAAADDATRKRRGERKDRLEEIQLRNAELDLGLREGRLIDVDEFIRDRLSRGLGKIRVGAERIATWPDAQRIMCESIEDGIEDLRANGSARYLTGDRESGSGGRGVSTSKADAGASGVRPKVRKDAGRRAPRRGKVP